MLCVSMLLILLLPLSIAEEAKVSLSLESSISDIDAGILDASLSPDSSSVLIAGMDGYTHLISATNAGDRTYDVELNSGRTNDLNKVAWHPRGEAALIAGDFGTALRYEVIDHGITVVNGTGTVLGRNLTSVEWRSAGDYAYFGSEDGALWRFSEGTGFVPLNNDVDSIITGISCHKNYDLCVVSSLADGLGVIGRTHNLSWISGTKTDTWIDVDCADPMLNECVAYGSGLRMRDILINSVDHTKSSVGELVQYPTLEGEFISVSRGHDSTTIVHLAPAGTVRFDPLDEVAKVQISSSQLKEWDSVIAGRQIVFVWETSYNNGFILTSNGNLVSFDPKLIEIEGGMLNAVILIAVSISVPGVIIGLIYMNSPFLQKKYLNYRKKRRLKKSGKKS